MEFRFLKLEVGRRANLVLHRPPLNILNLEMMEELGQALDVIEGDATTRVLLLRGEGKAFSAGVDVADHTEERVQPMLKSFHSVLLRLWNLEVPTVAQVHGHCLGGGMELAMACDLAYASDGAVFGQPEIGLAAFPPFGAAMYPTLLGPRVAAELILLGSRFPADRAFDLGIVNGVYPEERLGEKVDEVCKSLEGYSRAALTLAKKGLHTGIHTSPAEAVGAAVGIYLKELMATEDAKEGLVAFLEKRKPVWRDR